MRVLLNLFCLFAVVLCFASLARGQLILDEDDPETKVLINMMMKAINDHEHKNYTFKTVVYSLGESIIFKIMLKVQDENGVLRNCALNLHDRGNGFFKPEDIDCKHANE